MMMMTMAGWCKWQVNGLDDNDDEGGIMLLRKWEGRQQQDDDDDADQERITCIMITDKDDNDGNDGPISDAVQYAVGCYRSI